MYKKKEIGQIGEDLATKYLEENNYKIIQRNFLCKQGEIDIIAKQGKEYVFTEVKTRTNLSFGRPVEAVTDTKQKHIKEATKYYLYINKLENQYIRIDAIEIFLFKNRYKINHIKQIM